MFTNKAAGRRERIVLPNQADSILISSLTDKRNVTRNIHMRRTKRYTGYRLVIGTGTTIVLNMAYVIIPITNQSLIYHISRFISDGTVR